MLNSAVAQWRMRAIDLLHAPVGFGNHRRRAIESGTLSRSVAFGWRWKW